jgi:hypothetical protein
MKVLHDFGSFKVLGDIIQVDTDHVLTNRWFNRDVTFEIIPIVDVGVGSGFKYYLNMLIRFNDFNELEVCDVGCVTLNVYRNGLPFEHKRVTTKDLDSIKYPKKFKTFVTDWKSGLPKFIEKLIINGVLDE